MNALKKDHVDIRSREIQEQGDPGALWSKSWPGDPGAGQVIQEQGNPGAGPVIQELSMERKPHKPIFKLYFAAERSVQLSG